jgi:hypothetical protein
MGRKCASFFPLGRDPQAGLCHQESESLNIGAWHDAEAAGSFQGELKFGVARFFVSTLFHITSCKSDWSQTVLIRRKIRIAGPGDQIFHTSNTSTFWTHGSGDDRHKAPSVSDVNDEEVIYSWACAIPS